MVLLIKNILFIIVFPATVAVYLPMIVLKLWKQRIESLPEFVHWVGVVPMVIGLIILLACVAEFALRGKATPAPIDAPKRLVVSGLYRFVRNPMYVGVVTLVFGEAIYLMSPPLLLYSVFAWLMFQLFITTYEEPTLRKNFGEEYEAYCQRVRRWIPRFDRTG